MKPAPCGPSHRSKAQKRAVVPRDNCRVVERIGQTFPGEAGRTGCVIYASLV
jgi:hypothetical protein